MGQTFKGSILLLLFLLSLLGVAINTVDEQDQFTSQLSYLDYGPFPIEELIDDVDPEPAIDPAILEYCGDPYQVTCSRRFPSYDPSGHVRPAMRGEVNALRHMQRIIRENPSWSSDRVQAELAQAIFTPQRRERTFQVYRWARNQIIDWIEEQTPHVFSSSEAEILKNRVESLSLELPPPLEVYSDALDLITKNAVYYERTPSGKLRIRVGGAYLLNSTSWYNIVYTLAHEIAHAIDPCELNHIRSIPESYHGLIECFIEVGWVEEERSRCGPFEQTSEVFADWLASKILTRAMRQWSSEYSAEETVSAVINSTRDLCEQSLEESSLNLSYHQSPDVRIRSILGGSPELQTFLGCPQVS